MKILLKNALLINEGCSRIVSVLIEDACIESIWETEPAHLEGLERECDKVIDCRGLWLLPGVIDDQVHFREPGLTHKACIETESRAAIAGGVTSFMDMPNTNPATTTLQAWQDKMDIAQRTSWSNYSFFFGGTNDNFDECKRLERHRIPGLKLFLGSSTGNMLVDKRVALERFFSETDMIIATHCESEEIIRRNKEYFKSKYPADSLDVTYHPKIRSAEACYRSSAEAVEMATRFGSRLHILHVSTKQELSLFRADIPTRDKKITAEACVHHLIFSDEDYARLGNKIKWNPAVKTRQDRDALREAVRSGRIDIVATDHAPHLWSEKQGSCLSAASGGPLVQYSLVSMLDLAGEGVFSKELVVERMAHLPAVLFGIQKRGFVREGYFADLVLVDPSREHVVSRETDLSHCGWSPFEGHRFSHSVVGTILNGELVYWQGQFTQEKPKGQELRFGV